MQASELKIGNYIYLKSKNRIYEISTGYEIDIGTDSEDFEPIPLTEEILLKCGFEKHTGISRVFGDYSRYIGSKKYFINIDNHYFNLVSSAGVVLTICKIQYLHQLQNLTFALTDQELQINL